MNELQTYDSLFDEFKNDLDFKVESQILEITEQICEIMNDKELNRVDLSDLLSTSKAAITKMLDGSTNFTLKRLIKIADALDKELLVQFTEPAKQNRDFNAIESTIKETTSYNPFDSWNQSPFATTGKGKQDEPRTELLST